MFGEPDEKDLVEEDDAVNVSAEQDEPDCEEMEADGCDPTDDDDRWQQERDYAATHALQLLPGEHIITKVLRLLNIPGGARLTVDMQLQKKTSV